MGHSPEQQLDSRSPVKIQPPFETLLACEGVTRINIAAKQVLFYRGHLPPGLFILLRGAVSVDRGVAGEETLQLDATQRPHLLPPLAQLEQPASGTVALVEDGELIYVPRSIAMELALGDLQISKLVALLHAIDQGQDVPH